VSRRPVVHLVALGCPKARVEAEAVMAALVAAGARIEPDPARADVAVVHTCAFIEAAVDESLAVLLGLSRLRKSGRLRRLVAVGCLPQRYGERLLEAVPEIDAAVGVNDLDQVPAAVLGDLRASLGGRPSRAERRPWWRLPSGPPHVRYLKIAEGCSRRCGFCTIPAIRGGSRSRPAKALVEEARRLVDDGAVELVLVAQDVGRYGADRPGDAAGPPLIRLLRRLARIERLRWIRLLYLYPDGLDRSFLAEMARIPRVLPYFDVPVQHVSDRVLRAMRRGTRRRDIDAAFDRIRSVFGDPTIRTTLIVGHPGETERDFEELRGFVRDGEVHRIGLFRYSDEEGTASFGLPDKVPPAVSWRRFRTLRAEARGAMRIAQRALRGRVVPVLIDGPAPETELLRVGRTPAQAPEIDGITYLVGGAPPAGRIVAARIVRTSDADLVADLDLR
jgi:ribosomal protein S12 methylthiotransferase